MDVPVPVTDNASARERTHKIAATPASVGSTTLRTAADRAVSGARRADRRPHSSLPAGAPPRRARTAPEQDGAVPGGPRAPVGDRRLRR
ncbi:hypothetical protein GCM10023200_57600 [Actinomycetospora chlora]|uniref:Uncharacterized protein n=1 Tax=Actinomycetospora chlora TaxID=663608 RepID=A0ABP9CJ57_9PSEU